MSPSNTMWLNDGEHLWFIPNIKEKGFNISPPDM